MSEVTSLYPTATELTNPPDAVIKAYLIENVRGSLYKQHLVVMYHLRPMDGNKANKASFRMTHEIMVASVPSERQIEQGAYPREHGLPWNNPPDMNIQFHAHNDKNAAFLTNALVEVVKTGGVGITKEWLPHWTAMLEEQTKNPVYHQ